METLHVLSILLKKPVKVILIGKEYVTQQILLDKIDVRRNLSHVQLVILDTVEMVYCSQIQAKNVM